MCHSFIQPYIYMSTYTHSRNQYQAKKRSDLLIACNQKIVKNILLSSQFSIEWRWCILSSQEYYSIQTLSCNAILHEKLKNISPISLFRLSSSSHHNHNSFLTAFLKLWASAKFFLALMHHNLPKDHQYFKI